MKKVKVAEMGKEQMRGKGKLSTAVNNWTPRGN